MNPPILSFVAHSGTGKTTYLEKVIYELKRRGYKVGALKHDAHSFEIDQEGKDSWRMTQAGADVMVITSREKTALVEIHPPETEPEVEETVSRFFSNVDIVLTEGFKSSDLLKVEIRRQGCGSPLLFNGREHHPKLIAVVSDLPVSTGVPFFELNNVAPFCDFLEEALLPRQRCAEKHGT